MRASGSSLLLLPLLPVDTSSKKSTHSRGEMSKEKSEVYELLIEMVMVERCSKSTMGEGEEESWCWSLGGGKRRCG